MLSDLITFWPAGTRTGSGSAALSTFIIGGLLAHADSKAATVQIDKTDFMRGSP